MLKSLEIYFKAYLSAYRYLEGSKIGLELD
jgi:hypothetical protein